MLTLGHKYRWQVPTAGLLITGSILYLAYHCEKFLPGSSHHSVEFLRATLIEYSIALLLVVGLEGVTRTWLDSLSKIQQEVRNALNRQNETEATEEQQEASSAGSKAS